MTTLSVVIPAFNEEDGIQEVVTRVLSVRSRLAGVGVDDLEVIVVDDGSTDGTARAAAEVAGVRLIRHAQNGGYGAALKLDSLRRAGSGSGSWMPTGPIRRNDSPSYARPRWRRERTS